MDIALEIPLAALGFGGFFQGHHARAARVEMLHKALDGAAFAGSIAAFENAHNALTRFFHPALHFEQFDLQLFLFSLIHAPAHAGAVGVAFGQRRHAGIFGAAAALVLEHGFFKYLQLVFFIA